MAIKIVLIIFSIIAILVFLGLMGFKIYQHAEDEDEHGVIAPFVFGLLAVFSLVFVIFIPGNIHQVDATQVAVVKQFGTIKGTRDPGLHWDFYMTHDYVYYPTTIQEISLDSQAYSSDTQYIGLTVEMQYKINPEKATEIEKTYRGIDNLESKIKVVAIDKVKSVYAKYKATEVMEHREAISTEIKDLVETSVEAQYPVFVETIAVPNIDFSDTFEKSVEDALAAKVAAEQAAQQAKAEADKKKTEADAKLYEAEKEAEANLVKAQKEAEAIKVKAEANAEATVLEATATARATKLQTVAVARSLGFTVVETALADGSTEYDIDFTGVDPTDNRYKLMMSYLETIKYLETWDGKLPETLVGDDAAHIVISGNN